MNFVKRSRAFFLLNLGGTKKVESLKSDSISSNEILHGEEPFSVSIDLEKSIMLDKLNQWLGETKINSRAEMKIPYCIGMYPLEPFRKGEKTSSLGKKKKIWERPNKPSDIRDKSQEPRKETNQNVVKGGSVGAIRLPERTKNEARTSVQTQTPKGNDIRSESAQPQKKPQSNESSTISSSEKKTDAVSTDTSDDLSPTKEVAPNGKICLIFSSEDCMRMAKKGWKNPQGVKLTVEFTRDGSALNFRFTGGKQVYYHVDTQRNNLLKHKAFDVQNVARPPKPKRGTGLNPKSVNSIILASLEHIEQVLGS